jgi:hypothetical protein
MPVDHIRYDILVQQALRGMVHDVLADAAKKGLSGDHHFFITFDTNAEGVRISDRLHEQYPKEMTIVLQHQFWDLKVTDKAFEVGLSFGGAVERLFIPLAAIKGFADPSVQFGLQFETLTDEAGTDAEGKADESAGATPKQPRAKASAQGRQRPARTSVPASPPSTPGNPSPPASAGSPDQPRESIHQKPGDKPGAEVVRLDRFRKK